MAQAQKIKKKLLFLPLVTAVMLMGGQAVAEPPTPVSGRTISVSGEASEQLAADRVLINVNLVSKSPELAAAKTQNDAMVEQLVKVTKEFSIPKDKVSTSNIYIAPEYRYENNQQKFTGYTVNRSITVTIDDMSQHEKFLSALVAAKIDQIGGVEFVLANPKAHSEKLRAEAFTEAKTKAAALAAVAGAKLGPAMTISTSSNSPVMRRPMAMALTVGEAPGSSSAPSLPGMISLSESVEVSFALE